MQPQSAADVMKAETGKFNARHRADIHSVLQLLGTEGTLGKSLQ